MPELPEVETVLKTTLPRVKGQRISSIKIFHKDIVGWPKSVLAFANQLCGTTILDGSRQGKYLIFHLNSKKKLIIHLRMTGVLSYHENPLEQIKKHTHLLMGFSPKGALSFSDVRRFGRLYLVAPQELDKAGGLLNLGIDPLSPGFTEDLFLKIFEKRKGCLKGILLDQTLVAGLGNIYTDEVLFYSRLHPGVSVATLNEKEKRLIFQGIKVILGKAIAHHGTTFRDYRDGLGEAGQYQNALKVYGRFNKECLVCGSLIQKIKIVGRSSYFCPNCQKEPSA